MSDQLYRVCRMDKGTRSVIADRLPQAEAMLQVATLQKEQNEVAAYLLWERDQTDGNDERSPETYWKLAEGRQRRNTDEMTFYAEAINASSTATQPMRVAAKRS